MHPISNIITHLYAPKNMIFILLSLMFKSIYYLICMIYDTRYRNSMQSMADLDKILGVPTSHPSGVGALKPYKNR